MKKVLFSESKAEVLKCFENTDVILYIWQGESIANLRSIYPVKVQKLSEINGSVTFITRDYSELDLLPGTLFCFNEDLKSFFKLEQIEIQSNTLEVKIPDEIQVLSEKEGLVMSDALYKIFIKSQDTSNHISSVSQDHMIYDGPRENIDPGLMKIKGAVGSKNRSVDDQAMFDEIISSNSLSEEDKLYAEQRNAPRAKPKKGKVMHISANNGVGIYDLYDLSTGGASVVTFQVDDFTEQEEVSVMGFDDKSFDEPVKAIIRSIREIEDLPGQHKVGMQFLEE